jgi:hypothetical protein
MNLPFALLPDPTQNAPQRNSVKAQTIVAALSASVLLNACSTAPARTDTTSAQKSTPTTGAPASAGKRIVKSRDGSYDGEIIGSPAPDSKFSKLLIGMDLNEVQKILGRFPDETHSFESGKRWIPFYFGNDVRRLQMLYKGEGCLVFTGGGAFAAGGDLIQIQVDPAGTCYAP